MTRHTFEFCSAHHQKIKLSLHSCFATTMGNSFDKEESDSCCSASSEESFWDFGCSDSRRSSCSVNEKSPRAAHADCRQQIKTLTLQIALERRHRLEAEETSSKILAEVCQNLLQRVEDESKARAAAEAAISLLALEVQVLGRRVNRAQDCDFDSSICSSHIDVHSIADEADSDSDLPTFDCNDVPAEALASAPIQVEVLSDVEQAPPIANVVEESQAGVASAAVPIASVEQDQSTAASRSSPDVQVAFEAPSHTSEQPCASLLLSVEPHGDSDSDGWSDDSDFAQ